jgi:hypothetical protein
MDPLEITGSAHSVRLLDELSSSIEKTFEQVYQQQRQQHGGFEGEPMPPNRLPLKRRLADFRHHQPLGSHREADRRFSASSAVEKFRDITPAFVVAVFEETLVFEPGDIGPISMGHPVAQELMAAINRQELTPSLMAVLHGAGAPFYDGCLVVGLVDYRRQAFGVLGAGPSVPVVRKEANAAGAMPYRNPTMAPEMHKILLRPSSASLAADIDELVQAAFPSASDGVALEVEAQILLGTRPALCLDPDPFVGAALTAFHYDRSKMRAALEAVALPPRPRVGGAGASLLRPSGPGRLTFAEVVEGERAARRAADAEPFYGLDVKKDPGRFKEIPPNTPLFAWVQPNQRLWRTIRFESPGPGSAGAQSPTTPASPSQPVKRRHYTVHILLNGAGHFDVVFRRGAAPFTALDGETLRFRLANRLAADAYIERLQFIMAVDGSVCVGDVSNPTIFNTAMPGRVAMAMGGANAGPFAVPAGGGVQRAGGAIPAAAVPPAPGGIPLRGTAGLGAGPAAASAKPPAGLNPAFSLPAGQMPPPPPKK